MPSTSLTFVVLCKPPPGLDANTELAAYYNANQKSIGRVGDNVFVFETIGSYAALDGFRQQLKQVQTEFLEFDIRAGDTDFFVRGGFKKETMDLLAKHALPVCNVFRTQ